MNYATLGRITLSTVAAWTAVGSFVFDWNDTHVKNPNWPPHAKFHNAQTMSTGVLLALSTVFFTWRRGGDRATNVTAAALFAGNYWLTQFVSAWFPGAAWTDPEFLKPGERLDAPFPPQRRVDIGATIVVAAATLLMWPRSA